LPSDLALSETNGVTYHPVRLPRARQLGFFALVGVIFFTVSGGAYGLEPLVSAVGAGWAVVLVIATPILWSLPIALMVAELSSAMPEEGGYYVWVRRGLGDFWGVQEGWWTVCYTSVDMAIYPVLFVNYLAYFFTSLKLPETSWPSLGVFFTRWLIAVLLIVVALAINWRGAKAVGRNATLNIGLVLGPFILLTVIGLIWKSSLGNALTVIKTDFANGQNSTLLLLGLATVFWNYSGWDNVSTFAAEVNDAPRNYPRALITSLPLTVLAYLLPLLAGIAITTDPNVWSEAAGWPVIGQLMGGQWLGVVIAVAALISAWSLFNSQLLYVSRLPYAMALDGWLPSFLTRVSKKTAVPTFALVATCCISAIFAVLPFGKLVIIDVLLYSAALSLEFIALIVLRLKKPDMPRPFRVPGGWFGLVLVTIAPMGCAVLVAAASFRQEDVDKRQVLMVPVLMLSGVLLYLLRRRNVRRKSQYHLR
jgi:amino acid transporter